MPITCHPGERFNGQMIKAPTLYRTPADYASADLIICSDFVMNLPIAQRVYWLARALDRVGKGWTVLDLNHAAKALQVSRVTLRRYIYQCHRLGLLGYRWLPDARVRVWYAGWHRVARRLNVTMQAFCRIKVSELATLRHVAVEAAIDRAQDHSRFMACAERAEKDPRAVSWAEVERRVPAPWRIIDLPDPDSPDTSQVTSANRRGEDRADVKGSQGKATGKATEKRKPYVYYQGNRCLFVGAMFPRYGVTQQTIAGRIYRSERTVRRYAEHIPHRQLAQFVKRADHEFDYRQADPDFIEALPNFQRLFKVAGKIWKALTNIYVCTTELVAKRARRTQQTNESTDLLQAKRDRRRLKAQRRSLWAARCPG